MAEKRIGSLMMIDDNRVDQMLHTRIVQRSGLVDTVLNYQYADEALEYLRTEQSPVPDMILLDINMPRMDGFEFLEAFSRLPASVRTPVVVMLTTSLDPKDEARASRFEMVRGYLTKPLSHESLQSVVQI